MRVWYRICSVRFGGAIEVLLSFVNQHIFFMSYMCVRWNWASCFESHLTIVGLHLAVSLMTWLTAGAGCPFLWGKQAWPSKPLNIGIRGRALYSQAPSIQSISAERWKEPCVPFACESNTKEGRQLDITLVPTAKRAAAGSNTASAQNFPPIYVPPSAMLLSGRGSSAQVNCTGLPQDILEPLIVKFLNLWCHWFWYQILM